MSPNKSCELCQGDAITTRYFADDECWIADCVICRVPMVVWRSHDPAPPKEVRERMFQRLAHVADGCFGEGAWYFDDHMRKIPDHYHAHARAR